MGTNYAYLQANPITLSDALLPGMSRMIRQYNSTLDDGQYTCRLTDYVQYLTTMRGSMIAIPVLVIFS